VVAVVEQVLQTPAVAQVVQVAVEAEVVLLVQEHQDKDTMEDQVLILPVAVALEDQEQPMVLMAVWVVLQS
jgi:hypothetical protein